MFQRESSNLFCMMSITGWLWCQCKGNCPHLNLILGTLSNFAFLGLHQCSSRLVTVLLGTLWSSVKQIEAPFLFDWEKAIALDTVQGIRDSSRKRGKSHGFSRIAAGTWGIFSNYGGDIHS